MSSYETKVMLSVLAQAISKSKDVEEAYKVVELAAKATNNELRVVQSTNRNGRVV